jgi:Tfp pilus assembly protein PilW
MTRPATPQEQRHPSHPHQRHEPGEPGEPGQPAGGCRTRGDAGLSLVELIVAMALTAILLTVLVSVFTSTSRTVSRETTAARNSETASIAMRELSRVLRTATALPTLSDSGMLPVFPAAGPRSVTVHSWLDTGTDTDAAAPRPVAVLFEASTAGVLTETRWNAVADPSGAWTFPRTATSSRVLARGVGTGALFRYTDATGADLVAAAGASLDASQRDRIATVAVALTVQLDSSGRATPAVLQNTVGLPNLGVSRTAVAP